MHKQHNLIGNDIRQETVFNGQLYQHIQTGPVIRDIADEYFQINWMEVSIDGGHPHRYSDNEYSEIVESSNYFSFISKNRKEVIIIRYENITLMRMELYESVDEIKN